MINGSGPISFGGGISGQSINLEIGRSAGQQISFNDPLVRTLLGRPADSSTIDLLSARNKSLGPPSVPVGASCSFYAHAESQGGEYYVCFGLNPDYDINFLYAVTDTQVWPVTTALWPMSNPSFSYENGWPVGATIGTGTYLVDIYQDWSGSGGLNERTFYSYSAGEISNWNTNGRTPVRDPAIFTYVGTDNSISNYSGIYKGCYFNTNDNDMAYAWMRDANNLHLIIASTKREGAHGLITRVTRMG